MGEGGRKWERGKEEKREGEWEKGLEREREINWFPPVCTQPGIEPTT